jgi:hypothetical protein
LVRSEPDRVAALVDAGDALRAAQDRMLSGDGTADGLREAVERERAAVDALVSIAAEQGMSGAASDRVAGTLHAAALDTDARDQVLRGQLVEELQHVGFGGESLATAPPPRPSEREREEQRRLTEERKHARHAEREAGHRLEAAERALANAEQRREKTRAAFQDAEEQLSVARAEVQAASEAHDTARRALDSL